MAIEKTFKYDLQHLEVLRVLQSKNHYWFKIKFAETLQLCKHGKLSQIFQFFNF